MEEKTFRNNYFNFFFAILFILSTTAMAQSKKRVVRKVQEVNFAEMSIKGTVRNPDGAFLVQKKGIKFMPLIDVQKNMDKKIREASFYVR